MTARVIIVPIKTYFKIYIYALALIKLCWWNIPATHFLYVSEAFTVKVFTNMHLLLTSFTNIRTASIFIRSQMVGRKNSTKSFPKNKHVICVEKKKKFFKIFFEATQDQLFKHCNILERLLNIQFELLSWNFFACTDSESSKIKLTTYVLYLLLFAKDNPWRRLFSKRLSPKIAYFLFKANLLGNRN